MPFKSKHLLQVGKTFYSMPTSTNINIKTGRENLVICRVATLNRNETSLASCCTTGINNSILCIDQRAMPSPIDVLRWIKLHTKKKGNSVDMVSLDTSTSLQIHATSSWDWSTNLEGFQQGDGHNVAAGRQEMNLLLLLVFMV